MTSSGSPVIRRTLRPSTSTLIPQWASHSVQTRSTVFVMPAPWWGALEIVRAASPLRVGRAPRSARPAARGRHNGLEVLERLAGALGHATERIGDEVGVHPRLGGHEVGEPA